jgi:hypothetical protein
MRYLKSEAGTGGQSGGTGARPQLIKPVLQVPSPCAPKTAWQLLEGTPQRLHLHRSSYRSLSEPSIFIFPHPLVVTTHPDSVDTMLQL